VAASVAAAGNSGFGLKSRGVPGSDTVRNTFPPKVNEIDVGRASPLVVPSWTVDDPGALAIMDVERQAIRPEADSPFVQAFPVWCEPPTDLRFLLDFLFLLCLEIGPLPVPTLVDADWLTIEQS
jgi:hypothetical protein